MDLSIIIPVYNGAAVIGECLASIFAGEDARVSREVIVVDDGSTDDTPDIVRRYPVRYLRIEKSGVAAARNTGIAQAKGEILLFFDADVILKPDTIRKFVGHFQADPDAFVIQGRWDRRSPIDTFSAQFFLMKYHYNFRGLFSSAGRAAVANLETGCLGVRRSVFDHVQLFSTAYRHAGGEEHELGLRIMSKYTIYYYPDIFVEHRFGPISGALRKIYIRTVNFAMLMFNAGNRQVLGLHAVSVPVQDKVSVVLLALLIADGVAVLPVNGRAGMAFAVLLLALYGINIGGFVRYLYREKGALFAVRGAASDLLIMIPRTAGLLVAFANYYLAGRRDYKI